MAIPIYLAMTAEEMRNTACKHEHIAWMACHFSPYGTGLTNLPDHLPEGSLLILNDRTPIHSHDPKRILTLLTERVTSLKACGVLLDFEKAPSNETDKVIDILTRLPCPLCVSHRHIGNFDLPIFLPPVPILLTVDEYLKPWRHRKIWLELSRSSTKFIVTQSGTEESCWETKRTLPFPDTSLNCHYRTELDHNTATFYLTRTSEDLRDLLRAAESFGVEKAVGLWQELKEDAKTAPGTPERS